MDCRLLRTYKKFFLYAGVSLTVVAVCPVPSSFAGAARTNAHVETAKPNPLKVLWNEFLRKMHELAAADQLNEQLKARVAELEIMNQRLAYEALQAKEAKRVERLVLKSKEEGGKATSRTIASLQPADPKLLSKPPKAVFEAATAAFSKGDYETAASAFVSLASNSENAAYQRPQVFFMAAISLFKLENFKVSKVYLERTMQSAVALGEESDDLAYAPRAMAWLALVHEKLGDKQAKKQTIHELIQKYPKSVEARRLNSGTR